MWITRRCTLISWMMTFVMVSALFFSGFHQHDNHDGVSLEQVCQICVAVEHLGLGVLPSDGFLLSPSFIGHIDPVDVAVLSLPSLSDGFAQPRAPPTV